MAGIELTTISLEEAAQKAQMSQYTLKIWARKGAFSNGPHLDRAKFMRWLEHLPPRRCDLDASKRYYSIKEIEKMTGLSAHLIHRDIDSGKLKSLLCRERIHTYVVEEADLNHWLRQGSQPASPEAEESGWTLPRAAKFVGIAYELILEASQRGELPTREIPHFFLGKRRVVEPQDLLKWFIAHPIPYRKEVAHLPPVADIHEAARLSGRTMQSVGVCIREGSLEGWGKLIPRRSLDRWLKKLGMPPSWQPRRQEQRLPEKSLPSTKKTPAPTTLSLAEAAKRTGHSVDHLINEIGEARLTRRRNSAGELVILEKELQQWLADSHAAPEHSPWTITRINQRLGIPRAALQQAVESGALPARLRGRSWVVEYADLEKWADERSRI